MPWPCHSAQAPRVGVPEPLEQPGQVTEARVTSWGDLWSCSSDMRLYTFSWARCGVLERPETHFPKGPVSVTSTPLPPTVSPALPHADGRSPGMWEG